MVDPRLLLIVAADASSYGVGAVLSHRFPDGKEKAIFHARRSLTAAEKNYAKMEKEALALIFACKKFYKYIYGLRFLHLTDHRPLLAIFGSKSEIPVYNASRLQRWATMLLEYDFQIEYRQTAKFGQADALSRLIRQQQEGKEEEDVVIGSVEIDVCAIFDECVKNIPVDSEQVQALTEKDELLRQVKQAVEDHWPSKIKQESPLWSYYNRRDSLSIVRGCLMTGDRVVGPSRQNTKAAARRTPRGIENEASREEPGLLAEDRPRD